MKARRHGGGRPAPGVPSPTRGREARARGVTGRRGGRLGGGAAALATLGAATSMVAFSAPATAAARHPAAVGARVLVRATTITKYGKILVDDHDHALYYNTGDKGSHWACTGLCLRAWPPLTVPEGETAAQLAEGISGLGIVPGPSGRQVSWRGRALYTFARDGRGTVKGQGQASVWYVAQLSHPAPAGTYTAAGGPGRAGMTTTTGASGRGWG